MSRARIRLRPQARLDLIEAAIYMAKGDPISAERFLNGISDTLELLARNPMLGRERPELAAGLRSFRYRSHAIFYRPLKSGIELIPVLHGARDIASLF